MTVQDIWLANLRRLVDLEAGSTAPRDKRRGYRAIADLTGYSEEFIYQLYKGKPKANGQPRTVSPELATAIATAFANGRPLNWFDQPLNEKPAGAAPFTGVKEVFAEFNKQPTWPFRVSQARYAQLGPVEKAQIDDYIELVVLRWETSSQGLATGTGST